MFDSILILCTGNICRSPMAEALLKARCAPGKRVESAGLGALVDEPADPIAQELMAQRGLDLSDHRARQVDLPLAREFELLLVMEQGQLEWLQEQYPSLRGRVQRWGRWQGEDIPDPYRKDRQAFELALERIEAGLESWDEKKVLG